MERLIVLGVVGMAAQLVDGTLGMAYGVTSTTLLLSAGIAPAAASATVHLAELGTTLASGASHRRFGNVDWRTVRLMAIPGAFGAFLGAVVLSSLSAEAAKPVMAIVLFSLGVYILVRFALRPARRPPTERRLPGVFLGPLGGFAGFMDALGGGGWGPIGTPTLLSSGRLEPRKVVGSVDTGEFLVSLGASLGFLVSLSFAQVEWAWLGALLAGGLVAAPLAAWLVRALPARVLGVSVGAVILLTNTRTLGEEAGLSEAAALSLTWTMLIGVVALAAAAGLSALRQGREPAGA